MYGKDVCKDIVAGLSRLGLHPVIVSGLALVLTLQFIWQLWSMVCRPLPYYRQV